MDRRRVAATGLLALVLSGCGLAPVATRRVPPECEFPDGVRLSFSGETTMAELWIPAPGHERDQVYAWVTAEPIVFPDGREPYRVACVERGFRTYERSAYPGSLFRVDD